MKTFPIALAEHLQGEVLSLAYLWKITRVDGAVFRFTDHDQPITYGGEVYEGSPGVTSTSISSSLGMTVGDLEITGALSSEQITIDDMLAGRWDFARFQIYRLNWADPAGGAEEGPAGVFGQVRASQAGFSVECRDLMQFYQAPIGEISTPTCRVKKLGDARCRLNLAPYKASGHVTAATDRTHFVLPITGEENYYAFGEIKFLSGENAGLSFEVKGNTAAGEFVLQFPTPSPIATWDEFEVTAGCDRTITMCAEKFSNAVNFVGEPHKPTGDQLVRGAH